MTLRVLLLAAIALAACTRRPAPREAKDPDEAPHPVVARIDVAMAAGAAYLTGHQGEDGAWRSESYPALGDGWSLTPTILSALLFSPSAPAITAAYPRGADWLAAAPKPPGGLAYPVYARAGAIMVLSVPANARHKATRGALVAELRARQLIERLGWTPDDPSHGGWGYYFREPRKPPDGAPRHELLSSNLSATLHAVGALIFAGVAPEDPALVAARRFVERCQNHPEGDGGFFFTPANDLQNKAGGSGAGGRYTSYGTMTADGIRALLRLQAPRDGPRLTAAAAWLRRHFSATVPPGAFPADRTWQRDSAYYYWVWSAGHALLHLGDLELPAGAAAKAGGTMLWPEALAEELIRRQRADGAWSSTSTAMREDDPLVATPLAMAGLGAARMALTLERRTSIPMGP